MLILGLVQMAWCELDKETWYMSWLAETPQPTPARAGLEAAHGRVLPAVGVQRVTPHNDAGLKSRCKRTHDRLAKTTRMQTRIHELIIMSGQWKR